jgi:hypothetical protein
MGCDSREWREGSGFDAGQLPFDVQKLKMQDKCIDKIASNGNCFRYRMLGSTQRGKHLLKLHKMDKKTRTCCGRVGLRHPKG